MNWKFRKNSKKQDEVSSSFKTWLKDFFTWTKNSIFKKKILLFLGISFISIIGCTTSSMIFSSFLKNNRSITLREIAEDYSKKNKESPNGLVYYSQTETSFYETVYRNPEISREMEEVFYKNTFIDLYAADWQNLYSPGVVKYRDNSTVNLSFLMFPKNGYVDYAWKYAMPLLYPNNSSPLPRIASPNDIYINKEYAEKLLDDLGFPIDDYEKIYNKPTTIPFSWNYVNSNNRNPDLIDVTYTIKGVLDSNSEEYLNYKKLFGDFFIANEFFSLPIPSQTFFDLLDPSIYEKIFSTILDKYDYQTKRSNNLSGTSNFVYQTRISFFGQLETNCSIDSIWRESNEYTIKTNRCFDIFTSKNTLYIIIFSALNICSCFLLVFSSYRIKTDYSALESKRFYALLFWTILTICLGLLVGILLKNLIFAYAGLVKYVSGNNYIGTIIYGIEIATSIAMIILLKRKNNKRSVEQQ